MKSLWCGYPGTEIPVLKERASIQMFRCMCDKSYGNVLRSCSMECSITQRYAIYLQIRSNTSWTTTVVLCHLFQTTHCSPEGLNLHLTLLASSTPGTQKVEFSMKKHRNKSIVRILIKYADTKQDRKARSRYVEWILSRIGRKFSMRHKGDFWDGPSTFTVNWREWTPQNGVQILCSILRS